MVNSTDLRAGTTFLSDGQPYQVLKYTFVKMGRGSATVKVKARNLISGSIVDKSYTSNNVVEDVKTTKRRLQYLYKDPTVASGQAYFMDPRDFDQVTIPIKTLGGQVAFLKEGGEVDVLFWDERALSLDLPPKVTLTVTEADPGVKGNSASNIYKSAVLENGLQVKVPLFISRGEKIVIDTRTGEYIERASQKG
ncbi:MAG: elongation factor P [Candidatus Blackburnbacteria bacterium RIFCSPHIGHO2_01_FULL_43_15b]|uniref:Elongation factor P n=1 Tax=Candidatus Blackburnbacteria bacterium RIFCSPHIGHO2_01_FULL_43_15b TaxID=1797513 RepID=A0A1G1UXH4_9BACT|nr:MAG: elongation factor P [Candidatus Blackburnbacteria bacterium RIFCSPHIGHO2_01_FULL_43_15b]